MLLGAAGFCEQTANVWHLLGLVVNIIKIVIPLVLIILGMLDLGKAVVASDDKAITKAVGALAKRFIAALVMFFIPTIISAIFSAITNINLNDLTKDANVCMQCLTNAGGSTPIGTQGKTCSDYANALNAITTN